MSGGNTGSLWEWNKLVISVLCSFVLYSILLHPMSKLLVAQLDNLCTEKKNIA